MTFLFNDESISKVWYQTTQETTGSLRADFWGLLEAKYHQAPVKHSERIKSDFSNEISDRFPTKPIEQLAEDYPQIDVSRFGRGVSSKHMTYYGFVINGINYVHMTYYGFVINGINYVSGCRTRYGEYAYCESMRAPSYSTAKSAFVSLALMRLAQKYDPGVSELLIRDFISEYENSPGDWSKVTFNHTLDMATGNFRSSDPMADEENFDTDPFWNEEYYAEKIAAAFNWPHSTDPGEQWVYRTFDTFILTRAMQNFLQTLEGPDADIFNFLVAEIFTPLKIGPGAHSTLRTKDNNWQGQPYGGYGLWWIADDIAKFTAFLNVDQGSINGEQILHPSLLAAAMQRDPDDRGVDINSTSKYNNAFWARKYTQRDSYDCEFWVPHMLGYSGIVIVLMPNGTTYYYASDNQEFTWLEAIKESDKIIPQCQPPTTTILSQQGTLGDIAYRPTDGVEMVFVPGGTFQMGSEQTDPAAGLSEYPQHPVTLDSFWIDKTELPNTSYLNCVNDGACRESRYSKDPAYNGADLPVVGVSWQDAADYCVWVGGRLPTEAEWEYTARSHEGYLYPWGDEFDGNLVNYCDVNCQESWADSEVDDGFSENAPVGSFPDGSSWVGALDLAGNVWEWVSDWYSDYLPAKQINPTGPPIGEHKVIRGGCWANQMDGVRTVYRIPDGGDISPDLRHSNIGFRCVLSPDLSMNN
jgi:formylglycine-generating enzyme required for sulfatase activity